MSDHSYDLFLTHAWRYHEDWTQAVAILDAVEGLSWRNFSVPWHDPAMDPNTEVGARFIREWLESQILPVDAVLLLAGVHRMGSARKWVEFELDYARKLGKVVLGLPAIAADVDAFPGELRARVDGVASWNGPQMVEMLVGLLGARSLAKER